MRLVGTGEVGQTELGQSAVREHDYIVRQRQDVRRPPGALDDPSLRSIAELDPVAEHIRSPEREGDPWE